MNLLYESHWMTRSLRLLVAVVACAFLFFLSVWPASAYTASKNNPSRDDEIMQKSKEILRSGPPSMKAVQERSSKGLNEVQGKAEFNQMKRPENSQGSTIQGKLENALEKITPDN